MPDVLAPHPIKVSEAAVSAFDSECGLTLPQTYRDFLRRNNGGVVRYPSNEMTLCFRADPQLPPESADRDLAPDGFWSIALFHGLHRPEGDYGDLREIYDAMRGWNHPPELLPIASSIENFKYFLCTEGRRRDQILLAGEVWQEKRAEDISVTQEDFACLCMHFSAMIDTLAFT
jgi:hypothetical protein